MPGKSLKFLLFGEDVTAGRAFGKLGADAEKSGSKIKGAFSKGTMLAIGGLAIGLGEAVKAAGDFQLKTNVLVTAAGESVKNLGAVRKGIEGIAVSTGTSIDQLTEAAYVAEKAGYRGADAITLMRAAAQGAREEGAQLSTVLNAQTSIMASYHLKASDSVMVINEMKTAAGEAKTTMENFAGSLSTVLPIASANKISFADVAGSLATLTQHGTSADEATQELSNTIRNLAKPNAVAQKEMAQLGISANDVALKVGDGPGGRGLAGTLAYLSETVLKKMGPSGTVLLKTFNQSKDAAAAARTEYAALAPATQKVAKAYADGSMSLGDWRKALKEMTGPQASLASQWAATENSAKGFQSTLRSGLTNNQTYTAAIGKMTGGVNGLNTTLQLTGESLAGTKERIATIAAAARLAGKDVSGWESTQKLFNVQLDMLKQRVEVAGIEIGTRLLPVLTSGAKFTSDHTKAVLILGGALVGLKVALVGYRLAHEAVIAVQGIATAATKLFGRTAVATAAEVEAAAVSETAATEAAVTTQTGLLGWLGESYIGLGTQAEASAATQVAANDTAATSMGRAKVSAGGLAFGIVGIGIAAAAAAKQISNAQEKNDALAQSLFHGGLATDDLTTALVNNGGQLDDNVKSIVQASLAHVGLTNKAAKAGITTDQLTEAITGNKYELKALIDQWKASGKPSDATIAGLMTQAAAYHAATAAASRAASTTIGYATALSTIPKAIHTSVSVSGIGAAKEQIRSVFEYAAGHTAVIHVVTQTTTGFIGGGQQVVGATGGIVNGPTHALIGEAGPEAVIPLNRTKGNRALPASWGSGGGDTYLTINFPQGMVFADANSAGRAIVGAIATHTKNGGKLIVAGRTVN